MIETSDLEAKQRRFRAAYSEHRVCEGRGAGGERELLALPYLRVGSLAKQWGVRARTFDGFVRYVLRPAETSQPQLTVLDLGAGNGWFSFRMTQRGHRAIAIDIRADAGDGLATGALYRAHLPRMYDRVAGTFERLPLSSDCVEIAVFNASLHYAIDLVAVFREVARVVAPGGRLVVLDSPFYKSDATGAAMIVEKQRHAAQQFGSRADDLTTLPLVQYLTRDRIESASQGLDFTWARTRVRYPMWYELRPALAALKRQRPPSRFDLWETIVP